MRLDATANALITRRSMRKTYRRENPRTLNDTRKAKRGAFWKTASTQDSADIKKAAHGGKDRKAAREDKPETIYHRKEDKSMVEPTLAGVFILGIVTIPAGIAVGAFLIWAWLEEHKAYKYHRIHPERYGEWQDHYWC